MGAPVLRLWQGSCCREKGQSGLPSARPALGPSAAGKGQRPSWHLAYLEVFEPATGTATYFQCDQWLSKAQGDGAIQRVLKASAARA